MKSQQFKSSRTKKRKPQCIIVEINVCRIVEIYWGKSPALFYSLRNFIFRKNWPQGRKSGKLEQLDKSVLEPDTQKQNSVVFL